MFLAPPLTVFWDLWLPIRPPWVLWTGVTPGVQRSKIRFVLALQVQMLPEGFWGVPMSPSLGILGPSRTLFRVPFSNMVMCACMPPGFKLGTKAPATSFPVFAYTATPRHLSFYRLLPHCLSSATSFVGLGYTAASRRRSLHRLLPRCLAQWTFSTDPSLVRASRVCVRVKLMARVGGVYCNISARLFQS